MWSSLIFFTAFLFSGHSIAALTRKNKYIAPGATWYDTDGNVLSSHAGGVVKTNGTWYWFGQNERQEDKDLFSGINVYSSTDLLNWKNEGRALSPIPGTDIGPDKVVERPKAVFNEPTQGWVLWFHADNSTYGQLRQGVATSPNITGPYTFRETFRPLGNPSQDLGLFQDVDGTAYALYSNGDADADHDNLITRLNSNFTNVEEVIYTFHNFDLEAPNILYTGKRYYILMSHKTGYRPNNVVVFSAEELSGPWSVQSYIATLGTRTWNSQSTFTLTAGESREKTYIYCGDQWATGNTLYDSRYVWLPADIDDQTGSFRVEWRDLYSVDVKSGLITTPKGREYEAEQGVLTGPAYITLCPTCSRGKVITGIEGNSTVTINGIVGTGKPQWVSVYYHNPDGLWGDNRNGVSVLSRTATYSVNGGAPVSIIQRSGSSGIILSQPLNVTFNIGGGNSLTFAGFNGGLASDLDKIVVYGNIYED
ncbi:Arabinanase/levansucrase/invertase [Lyophyllum atratum]|nr:Arabinanase/levansucrase/invertase [Lyophyllum atratum]